MDGPPHRDPRDGYDAAQSISLKSPLAYGQSRQSRNSRRPESTCIGYIVRCNQNSVGHTSLAVCQTDYKHDAATQVRPRSTAVETCCSSTVFTDEPYYMILKEILNTLHNVKSENKRNHLDIKELLKSFDDTEMSGLTRFKLESRIQESIRQSDLMKDINEIDDFSKRTSISESKGIDHMHDGSLTYNMQCENACPHCGLAIKVLLAEIEDLRRIKIHLMHVRDEANEILSGVIQAALTSSRIQRKSSYKLVEEEKM